MDAVKMLQNPKIIVAVHIFNFLHTPFNRGLARFGGMLVDPEKKFELIKTTIQSYISLDPGVPLDLFVINNQGTDCDFTKAYLAKLDGTKTKYNVPIKVMEAPDNMWPGPFGSRNFTFRAFPNYDFYFETDSDNMILQEGWLKILLKRYDSEEKIGLIGAYLDRKGFQAPNTVKWYDINGNAVNPPVIRYNSGAFTFVPRHIFEGFDKYWGENWVNQGNCFFDYAGAMGELYFAWRVEQLGYKNVDLITEDTEAPYDWIVPDRLFPNMTVGKVSTYPTSEYISPFYNTYLAMRDHEKVKWIQDHYKNCKRRL